MTNQKLSLRILSCIERQIEWCESMLHLYTQRSESAGVLDLDTLQTEQHVYNRELHSLDAEFRILLHEWWEASDISEEDQRDVAIRAQYAQELITKVQSLGTAEEKVLHEHMASHCTALGQLRKGHETARRYRAGEPEDQAGYLDRNA